MGDSYEVVYLAGKVFIEHLSENTNWELEAVELCEEDVGKLYEFQQKQAAERTAFLKAMCEEKQR